MNPTLLGQTLITPKQLVVRSAKGDITVNAPLRLTQKIFQWCDGTRTIEEILDNIPQHHREEFSAFMQFLMDEGVLVDANHITLHALDFASQANPFGLSAPESKTAAIARRFVLQAANLESSQTNSAETGMDNATFTPVHTVETTPLDEAFQHRHSAYVFNPNAPVELNALLAALWSAAGIVNATHERLGPDIARRTLGSAGSLHLLELHCVLLQPSGPYEPGVYRVHYPNAKQVQLLPTSTNPSLDATLRSFAKPWVVQHAACVLFVTAKVHLGAKRYRNRALQYAFMECGAALQNVALSMPQLGLMGSILGSYYENAVQMLLQLHADDVILGSMVVGNPATPAQLQAAKTMPNIEFAWVENAAQAYQMPCVLARARIKQPFGQFQLNQNAPQTPYTWGRGHTAEMAMTKAMAEAIERQGYQEPRNIVVQSLEQCNNPVNPALYPLFSRKQFQTKQFPYAPFDETATYWWTIGECCHTGKPREVLAEKVFSRQSLIAYSANQAQTSIPTGTAVEPMNSSGCAAHVTLQDATDHALLELFERDAFMQHWLAKVSGTEILTSSLPQYIQQRIHHLQESGCIIGVQQLNSRWAHVALLHATHHNKHFTTMATAAHHTMLHAIENAMDELEARVYAWLLGHQPSKNLKPKQVQTPEHHFELYGLKKYYLQAKPIFSPTTTITFNNIADHPNSTLETRLFELKKHQFEAVRVNITPKLNCIENGQKPLHVIRMLVPDLLPISFGYMLEPLGHKAPKAKSSYLPHPFP